MFRIRPGDEIFYEVAFKTNPIQIFILGYQYESPISTFCTIYNQNESN